MTIMHEPPITAEYPDSAHRPTPGEIKEFTDDTDEREADRKLIRSTSERVSENLRRGLGKVVTTLRRDGAASPDEL